MNNSIQKKIITRTSLLVIIVMLLSGLFYIYYFSNILKEQAVEDDKIKLTQTARQIEYITDDIKKFAYNIIIDKELQDFYKYIDEDAVSDYINTYNAMQRLTDYVILREYLISAACVDKNGESTYTLDDNYDFFQSNLEEDWYRDFLKNPAREYFSALHTVDIRGDKIDVISYIVDFRDMDLPEESLGYLILNVKYSYIIKFLDQEDYDSFLLCDAKGDILYSAGESNLAKVYTELMGAESAPRGSSFIEQQNGYIIKESSMNNGWTLFAFTSNKSLYSKINSVNYIFLFLILGSIILMVIMIRPVVLGIVKPITRLSNTMTRFVENDMQVEDMGVHIKSGDEIENLGNCFNQMIGDLRQYVDESIENEKIKKDMAFNLLISQINPHFIYNTLNTIIYIAKKQKNQDITKITDSLISILQDAIRIGEEVTIATIQQEIDVVKHYAIIQEYRYPERFGIEWDVDEQLMDCQVPKTILQPLVENALLHGIFPCKDENFKGTVKIIIKSVGDDIHIEIRDNGIGMTHKQVSLLDKDHGKAAGELRHIGIANIRGRIRYLFGPDYGLSISSASMRGTLVTVKLPIRI